MKFLFLTIITNIKFSYDFSTFIIKNCLQGNVLDADPKFEVRLCPIERAY